MANRDTTQLLNTLLGSYNLDNDARRGLEASIAIAQARGHSRLTAAHILLVFLEMSHPAVSYVTDKFHMHLSRLRTDLIELLDKEHVRSEITEFALSDAVQTALRKATEYTQEEGLSEIDAGLLVSALWVVDKEIIQILERGKDTWW